MKKVLVLGAGGAIGQKVIKFLLSEGKYEITSVDLRTKLTMKTLRKYRRRVNLVFGDINDPVLMEALVKEHDYIIHLAGVLPPLADIKEEISDMVEFKGTENVIKNINFYNPNCHLIYTSSTSIYGENCKEASIKSKAKVEELDYYTKTKIKCEELIKEKLKNYTIVRLPLVLTNPKNNAFMYNIKRGSIIESITDNDAAFMIVKLLDNLDKVNKKVYNVSGGEATRDMYAHILGNVLEIYGLSWKYLTTRLFIDKNYYSPILSDTEDLEAILNYQSDSLSSYYMTLKRSVKGRYIARLLAKPFAYALKRKK